MKASLKMVVAIACVFIVVICVAAIILVIQAHHDIRSEINSSFSLAAVVLKDETLSDQAVIDLLHNSRHVELEMGHVVHQEMDSIFSRFYFWLQGEDSWSLPPVSAVRKSGLVMTIYPSWVHELDEISDTVLNVLFILLLALIMSLATVYLGINRRIKPLKNLSEALEAIGEGHYQTRLRGSDIMEIDLLIAHYNRMRKLLEQHRNKLSQLQQQIHHLQEEERAALARELHDHLGQLITTINMKAYLVTQKAASPEVVKQQSEQVIELCAQLHQGIKQIINQLHPMVLSSSGLKTAIKQLVQQWQIQHKKAVTLHLPEQAISLELERDTHFYRVLQESLHNIVKHSDADQIEVALKLNEQQLTLEVRDNGRANTHITNMPPTGLGHFSMRERASILKGTFNVGRTMSNHYQISFSVPLGSDTLINADSIQSQQVLANE